MHIHRKNVAGVGEKGSEVLVTSRHPEQDKVGSDDDSESVEVKASAQNVITIIHKTPATIGCKIGKMTSIIRRALGDMIRWGGVLFPFKVAFVYPFLIYKRFGGGERILELGVQ